jgi:hypothetical protein
MRPDRLMWAVGLALAVAVFAGLVLNLVTGLTRLSWAVALAIVLVACACAGLVIRRRRADGAAHAPVLRRGFHLSPVTGGFLLLAAVLAGGSVWLANASTGWQHSPGFAQLWLVPAGGTTATLGVRDSYPGSQTLHLVLRGGGQTLGTWDLALSDGETWQKTVTEPPVGKLTATLATPGQPLAVTS